MDFLDQIFFNNTLAQYGAVLLTILVVLLLRSILSHYLASFIFHFIQKAWKKIEKAEFKKMIVRPLGWLIVVVVAVTAIDKLNYPAEWDVTVYGFRLQIILQKVGICFIIIAFTRFILSLVDFVALILEQKAITTQDMNDDQIIVFFRDFLKVLITIAGTLFLIKAGFNQNIGSLLTGLSIVGAAMALAAKESLENLIASFIIFFDKPFYVGDTLKVNAITGTVERIGLRSTRIRTADKTLVTVPNKQMVDSIVDNYSMRNERRAEIKLELSLKTPTSAIELFIANIKEMLAGNGAEIIAYSVYLTEYNKNAIVIMVEYFTIPFTMDSFLRLKQTVIITLKRTLEEMKVDMASSAADINIYQGDGEPVPPPAKSII